MGADEPGGGGWPPDAVRKGGGPVETKRPGLGPILLTVFLDLLGFGLVIPLMGFYAEQFSASPGQVTALMAAYSIAQFLFAPVWGAVSDRYGRRPVLIGSIGASVLFLGLFAMAQSYAALVVLRALHGVCAANIGTAQAYVADVTEGKDRAKGMGLIGAAFGVGFTVGPMVGGLLSGISLSAPIWLAAGLALINLVWVVARLPESRRAGEASAAHARSIDPRALLHGLAHPVVGLCLLLTFVATFSFAMMESTFQLVAEHVWGKGPRDVGYLFGVIGVVGIVIQGGLIRRLVPRFGEQRLITLGYAVNAAGMWRLAAAPAGPLVWLGCAVMAVGTSLANPSLQSLISRSAGEDEQGVVLGTNQSFSALARALAPLAGGVAYEQVGPLAPLMVGGALMWAAMALSVPAGRRAELPRGA